MLTFSTEIGALKRLDPGHLVKIRGTYSDRKAVAFPMEPVVDCDLGTYLESMRLERLPTLRSFFGCLATATAYLHSQKPPIS